ncbi:hypothetical protein AZI85_01660 [Bdellovibrio bacteriovorus]|uniref:Uncharacterized protein n=1 Tax=Bdellovibrio bacteriovorus TaxID=959 RepID=A0A150WVX5_BDEBC|nr:hypothetical protein AZI85_01660 [Bdellovibrio bacteriovorus]
MIKIDFIDPPKASILPKSLDLSGLCALFFTDVTVIAGPFKAAFDKYSSKPSTDLRDKVFSFSYKCLGTLDGGGL